MKNQDTNKVSCCIVHWGIFLNSVNDSREMFVLTTEIIRLFFYSARDFAGKMGTVIGWGRTSEGGMLPNIVHEVDVPILTLDQCRAMKYRASRITTYMLCAGKGSQDSCQGDSGGPLLIHSGDKYEIIGK